MSIVKKDESGHRHGMERLVGRLEGERRKDERTRTKDERTKDERTEGRDDEKDERTKWLLVVVGRSVAQRRVSACVGWEGLPSFDGVVVVRSLRCSRLVPFEACFGVVSSCRCRKRLLGEPPTRGGGRCLCSRVVVAAAAKAAWRAAKTNWRELM